MENGFPEFEQTTWGKHFLAFEAAGLFESEAQRSELLRISLDVYRRVKERHESQQRDNDDGRGLGLSG
jgi:hypothetical protein